MKGRKGQDGEEREEKAAARPSARAKIGYLVYNATRCLPFAPAKPKRALKGDYTPCVKRGIVPNTLIIV